MFQAKRLKAQRQRLGLSQANLAKQLGIARSSYFNWENGKTQPNQAHLQALARLLEVEPSYFENDYDLLVIYQQLTPPNQVKTLTFATDLLKEQDETTHLYEYHVYEKLSAGGGYAYVEDRAYDRVFFSEAIDHDLASWVFGDSMEPLYLSGSVALIKDTGFDYDGGIYAVDWDGQTYIKKVYRQANGLRLVSLNPKYQDKFAPFDEEPRIIGKIVGNFMPLAD